MFRFSFLVLVFFLCISFSQEAKVVDVNTICMKAQHPSFCSSLLNSKPGPKDLVSLAQYTIGVIRVNLTNTMRLTKTLIAKSGNDVKAKSHYEACLDHFGDEGALGDLADVQESLRMGDYQGVGIHASALTTNVDDCVSGDSPTDPPYHDTTMLPKHVDIIEQVAEIIDIISHFLEH